jgi:capsule polysaccharide export protein KpsE/RkpR
LVNLDREIVEKEAQLTKRSARQSEPGPEVLALKSQLDQLKKQRDDLAK